MRPAEVLDFRVRLEGTHSPGPEPRQVDVRMVLRADGEDVREVVIRVELPPA